LTFQIQASDPEGGPLRYVVLDGHAGARIDTNGVFIWQPRSFRSGDYAFRVVTEDFVGARSHEQTMVITVNNPAVVTTTDTTAVGTAN